jgi:hypothetical protein
VNARLKEIARSSPGPAEWKDLVERLAEKTPGEERMRAYHALRQAAVLPDDAAWFLLAHAVQLMPSPDSVAAEEAEHAEGVMERHILTLLRRYGADEVAETFVRDRLEHDRRYERGRQFFHGPPDEEFARRLRERGVID